MRYFLTHTLELTGGQNSMTCAFASFPLTQSCHIIYNELCYSTQKYTLESAFILVGAVFLYFVCGVRALFQINLHH